VTWSLYLPPAINFTALYWRTFSLFVYVETVGFHAGRQYIG